VHTDKLVVRFKPDETDDAHGIGVERLRDLPAEWSQQFDSASVRNSLNPVPDISNDAGSKIAAATANVFGMRLQSRLPGTKVSTQGLGGGVS
jgi:hypothetical protein